MSSSRIVRVATLVAAVLMLLVSPVSAATPDVGVRVTPTASGGTVAIAPWVWEPDRADQLRIAVGTSTRRIVIRVWGKGSFRSGRLVEQTRGAVHGTWITTRRMRFDALDLAGGSTDPGRTRYRRAGFLAFDAASLSVEPHGGLAFSVHAAVSQRLVLRFGARDQHSHAWSSVTRVVTP